MRGRNDIATRISDALGSDVERIAPLAGSYGLSLDVVELADGRRLVAKHGSGPRPDHLLIEGRMLKRLEGEIPVPHVHLSEPDLLVMDYIAGSGGAGASVERHMAELLSVMHGKRQPFFGLEFDTTIGPLPQPNPRHDNWIDFFRDQRLMFMARLAHERAGLSASLLRRIEKFCAHLDEYITEPAHPALLHGDIWGGNVIASGGKVAAFIDPAIYYGHPEYDLAFMTMFGTAGRAFFEAYAALRPEFDLEGFMDVRRDVYLIYPHLTHVLICGLSYASGIESRLRKFGF
jgi:fructosamine-3-kinase